MSASTVILYAVALFALAASFLADRGRTRLAVRKATQSFMNVLPEFVAVLGLVGLMLTFISQPMISRLLGTGSGPLGFIIASIVGSITLIPGFVAFPLAATLLNQGAGVAQVAVFVSTLMMVGFVTFPLERKYFGRRAALLRNGMAYVYSLVVALIIGADDLPPLMGCRGANARNLAAGVSPARLARRVGAAGDGDALCR